MNTPKLFGYWRSSSTWRVRIALAYKGVNYQPVPVNLSPEVSEQLSARFVEVNESRQVPVLQVTLADGTVRRLAQSLAILEYLEEKHPTPPLLPAGLEARAHCRRMAEIINSSIQPFQNVGTISALHALLDPLPADDVETRIESWCRSWIERGLGALEALHQRHTGPFLVASHPTFADVCLVPQLYNARRFGVDLDPYPSLLAAEHACLRLAAFQRSVPEVQPDAPPASPPDTQREMR